MLILNWLVLALVALAGLAKVALVLPTTVTRRSSPRFAGGCGRICAAPHPARKLFNSYNFGGYLLWALYPDYPVYVDGRTDLYDDKFLRSYLSVMAGRPGDEATLDNYGVNVVLVEANALLGDRLAEDPHWRKAYAKLVVAVYEREP